MTAQLTEDVDVAGGVRVAINVGSVTRHHHEVCGAASARSTHADQGQVQTISAYSPPVVGYTHNSNVSRVSQRESLDSFSKSDPCQTSKLANNLYPKIIPLSTPNAKTEILTLGRQCYITGSAFTVILLHTSNKLDYQATANFIIVLRRYNELLQ